MMVMMMIIIIIIIIVQIAAFHGTEISLWFSRESTTDPIPEADKSSPEL
jgi:hypothetical protein